MPVIISITDLPSEMPFSVSKSGSFSQPVCSSKALPTAVPGSTTPRMMQSVQIFFIFDLSAVPAREGRLQPDMQTDLSRSVKGSDDLHSPGPDFLIGLYSVQECRGKPKKQAGPSG
jgi:hypothetical protein